MTNDSMNERYPENEADVDEAAEAFTALRRTLENQGTQIAAEMTVIRRGVEAAFEQFEKYQQPTDYSEDLGVMRQALVQVVERMIAIEKSPLLKNGPEHFIQAFERAGESRATIAARQFESESRNLQRAAREMEDRLQSALDRDIQNRTFGYIGVAGAIFGILLVLFLPRILPQFVGVQVASLVLGAPPWQAGMNLISYASPESVGRVAAADQLVETNKVEIAACRDAAKKAGKEQKCTITVAAPTAGQ